MSHPMWVRGLKQNLKNLLVNLLTSHPMWVRGLKHEIQLHLVTLIFVAPHVGAWIETMKRLLFVLFLVRRTPCGCVD